MSKHILIIVPSRSGGGTRQNNIDRLHQSWQATTSGQSDLMIALDDDDDHNYPRIEGVLYEVNPRMRMCPTLNHVAVKYANQYDAITFMGDDHKFVTPGWEEAFLGFIDSHGGIGICYGNDLLQGPNLPTAVTLSSNIVSTLGYMVPPALIHMYADNFWRDMGRRLNILQYFPNIIIEHVHYSIGKTGHDQQYAEVDQFTGQDGGAYRNYQLRDMDVDADKLLKALILNR
jgi:hypothetical protein